MSNPVDIVTLGDVKTFLNINGTESDTELPTFITAASQMWVSKVGPVQPVAAITETYDGGSDRIVLRQAPTQSVATVTERIGTITYTLNANDFGTPWGYTLESGSVLVRRAAGVPVAFAAGTRSVSVTYMPGMSSVPADIYQAVLLLIRHLWETQRGGGKRPGNGDALAASSTFTWPNRVLEIAQAYIVPGIA